MKIFWNVLLISSGAKGGLWFFFLFFLCFLGIHAFRLVKLGWTELQPSKKPTPTPKPEPKPQEKAPAKPQEPIYYVIERKRKKPKTTYSEPRQITFK